MQRGQGPVRMEAVWRFARRATVGQTFASRVGRSLSDAYKTLWPARARWITVRRSPKEASHDALRPASSLALALAALAPFAAAQDYPNRPVRIIVPFAAGGPADVYARVLAQRLQDALGQPFVVDNRPGGGSVIGTDAVAKSAADGYTLLLMSNTHTVNESLMPQQAVRADARLRRRRAGQLLGPRAGRAPVGARRTRSPSSIALAKAQAGQAELRVVGPRHAVPHGRRALQGDGGRRHPARAVQGQRGRAHRHPRRPGADDVRRGHRDEPAREAKAR